VKIGIHHTPGSFSERWLTYCDEHKIPYKLVDAMRSDIVAQLSDCDGFMWHWNHADYRAQLFARQLIYSLELGGMKVFPNSRTVWHFDDKLGQKYLFDSLGIDTVQTYIFYDKETAIAWAKEALYPKVFKLRGGAGSSNIRLVGSFSAAQRLIRKSFGRGYPLIDRWSLFKDGFWHMRRNANAQTFLKIAPKFIRLFLKSNKEKLLPRQKGYVYFQDYIPGLEFDDRLVVIGDRCFFIRRGVRKNDFRASGSGILSYNHVMLDTSIVKKAFSYTGAIGSQALAFDFVYERRTGKYYILEISYCFSRSAYDNCEGFWDSDLVWHDEEINPQFFIIEDFIHSLQRKNIPALREC